MNGPIVILAPHASHPPMDGASYRSWSITQELSRTGAECYYFAKDRFFKILPGGASERIETLRSDRGKNWSALRTLLFRSHYLVEKHLPKAWVKKAGDWLKRIKPEVLYIHFLWTWNSQWKDLAPARIYIDTHNYDPEWWNNLSRSGGYLSRRACRLSCSYVLQTLSSLPADSTLVHVSEADRERYVSLRSDLRQVVLANGCDVEFRHNSPDYAAPRKQLYFLGALNLQITTDALDYLAERFWPALRGLAGMHVFGSGESPRVEALCAAHGWTLHKNLPDADLARELARMHYLVLPFAYSAGSKLKLIYACGKGIPIIATPQGTTGFDSLPSTVFISEDPTDWANLLERSEAPTSAALAECRTFAEKFSWPRLVEKAELLSS